MDKQLPTLIQFQVMCLIPREGIGGPDLRQALRKQRVMGSGRAVFYEMLDRLRRADWVSATEEVVAVEGEGFKQNRYKITGAGREAIRAFRAATESAIDGRTSLGWGGRLALVWGGV